MNVLISKWTRVKDSRKQNTTRVTHRPATYKKPIVANMENIKIEIRERTTITECRLLDILFCIFFLSFFFSSQIFSRWIKLQNRWLESKPTTRRAESVASSNWNLVDFSGFWITWKPNLEAKNKLDCHGSDSWPAKINNS